MVGQPTWQGLGRGVLVLAVLWWAWAAYAWLTSVVEPEEGAVRIVMFVAMASLLVCGLCVPEVFGDRGPTFAIAYAIVRAAHIALFMIASRDDPALRRSVRSFGTSTALAVGTLIAASFFEGSAQMLMWLAVVAIDTIGAQFRGSGRRLVPTHFAERHNLVVILALGESVIALGFGAIVDLTAGVLTVAVLGMALVCALWWIYFDVVAIVFLACIPLSTKIDSMMMLTGAVIALWLMIAYETHRYGELR